MAMNCLGEDLGFPFILRGPIVLPGGEARLTYKRERFLEADIQLMLNNPHESYYSYLLPEDGYNKETNEVTSLAVMVYLKSISLTETAVEVDVSGLARADIKELIPFKELLYVANVEKVDCSTTELQEIHKLAGEIIAMLDALGEDYVQFVEDLKIITDHSYFADYMMFGILETQEDLKRILNTISILERMKEAHMSLSATEEKPSTAKTISSKNEDVQVLIDKYYEIESLLNHKAQKEIFTSLKSLSTMSNSAADYNAFMRYAELAVNLPYAGVTTDNDLAFIEPEIEKSHYGMDEAKERLVEYIAIRQLNPKAKGTVILLDGPAGTGKTTLAQSMAEAMGRKCERISMGGCNDATFIKGHGRTYTGSRHGRIIAAMSAAGVKNPVIILDEVEKVSAGNGGDPEGAMLELLDPNQNSTFTDTYLGFGFDMSEVLFICTSNDADSIYPALLDRMERIDVEGYDRDEKVHIATKYVIPKKAKEMGIEGATISKAVVKHLINGYSFEPGIRGLEKRIDNLFRKVAVDAAKGKWTTVTKKLVTDRLGHPYVEEKPLGHTSPGIVTGMYYSASGGGCLDIEAIITSTDGEGFTLTGQAGDVMKESLSLVHAHMKTFQFSYRLKSVPLKTSHIHVHIPEGSTPKDGPSAGAGFALLLASIASNKPVKAGLAITGECTLTGRITGIGGVDQKCAGAVRMGMTDIILPEENRRDYHELPTKVKNGARYHFVTTVEEVIAIGLNI